MENQWTTSFFTVRWLPLCGILSSLDLVCLGLCLGEFSICLLVGGILEGRRVLRFGRWCQYAFFGVWKERNLRCFEDVESSMEDILVLFFHTLYLWMVAFLSPLSLSFVDFLGRFSILS
jgi:hypothetical protein